MEPEGLLSHSQVPAHRLYPQPDRSSPWPTSHFLKIHFNIIIPSTPGSSKWFLYLSFPHLNPVHAFPLPIRATCPAHLILLDLITRIILGGEYRSFSSYLCSFLHSPMTSSLVSPRPLTLFITLFSKCNLPICNWNEKKRLYFWRYPIWPISYCKIRRKEKFY
jgi:hypothetical protein